MELSSGLVLGLQPVGRMNEAVVHCHSEWPLRVQCDGQSGSAHTGSLYQDFLDSVSVCVVFFFAVSLTQCHTCKHTHCFSHKRLFLPLSS